MRTIRKDELETHRVSWMKVAKENGWYVEPFFVQIWTTKDGFIADSVSFKGMTRDIICDNRQDKELKPDEYTIEYNTTPFLNQLTVLRNSAVTYLTKVLVERGTNYELIDPAMYEDEVDDSVRDLPSAVPMGKYGPSEAFPIVVININDKNKLSFVGIGVLSENTDEDELFSEGELTTDTLCALADLVASLEK